MTHAPPIAARAPSGGPPRMPARKARKAANVDLLRWVRLVDVDLAFGFAMFLPMVFLLQLGMKGAAGFALATMAYAALRWRELPGIVVPRLLLFVPAVMACFSFIWSDMPEESLKQGVELGATLFAAVLVASARKPDMMLRGIAGAFLVYVAVSLAFGGTVRVGSGGIAFSGLGKSKNLVADTAATGLIITLGAAWLAARSRQWWWALGIAVAAVLEVVVVIQARSAGAMLGLGVGLATLAALAALRTLPKLLRLGLGAVLATAILSIGIFYRAISSALIEMTTLVFDKDPTLTGRTYLWDRGMDLVRERPMLGYGFQAFWHHGNTEAEGLWRYAGIKSRTGFSFHNTFIEILVQLGWVGLVALMSVVAIAVVIFAGRFVARPTAVLCVWGAVMMYELVRMPIESIGFSPFFFSTVLLFAALAMAFEPRRRSGPELAPAIGRYAVPRGQYVPQVVEDAPASDR